MNDKMCISDYLKFIISFCLYLNVKNYGKQGKKSHFTRFYLSLLFVNMYLRITVTYLQGNIKSIESVQNFDKVQKFNNYVKLHSRSLSQATFQQQQNSHTCFPSF